MPNDVGEDRSNDRLSPSAGRPVVLHQAKGDPEDGQECRSRHEVAVYIVEIEFLDHVGAPSAGPMLHFREKRLYHIADTIAPLVWKLNSSNSLMAPAAELGECPAEGHAPEVPPRVAHGSDSYSTFGANHSNRVTSIRLEIIRSVAADHLTALRSCIKDRDVASFQTKLGFHALETAQDAPPHPVLTELYFVKRCHMREVMFPQLQQKKLCIIGTALIFGR